MTLEKKKKKKKDLSSVRPKSIQNPAKIHISALSSEFVVIAYFIYYRLQASPRPVEL